MARNSVKNSVQNFVKSWTLTISGPVRARILRLHKKKRFTTVWSTSILLISGAAFDTPHPGEVRTNFHQNSTFLHFLANLSSDSYSLQKMLHNGVC